MKSPHKRDLSIFHSFSQNSLSLPLQILPFWPFLLLFACFTVQQHDLGMAHQLLSSFLNTHYENTGALLYLSENKFPSLICFAGILSIPKQEKNGSGTDHFVPFGE